MKLLRFCSKAGWGLFLSLSVVRADAWARPCHVSLDALPNLRGRTLHQNLVSCLDEATWGRVQTLESELAAGRTVREEWQSDRRYLRYLDPVTDEVVYSQISFGMNQEELRFFTKGMGDRRGDTFFSLHRLVYGEYAYDFFRSGASGATTFFSLKWFKNPRDFTIFYRFGRQDTDTRFSYRIAYGRPGDGESEIYSYRLGPGTGTEVAKIWVEGPAGQEYTRIWAGEGAREKVGSIEFDPDRSGWVYRDGQGALLSEEELEKRVEHQVWKPLLEKMVEPLNVYLEPRIRIVQGEAESFQ